MTAQHDRVAFQRPPILTLPRPTLSEDRDAGSDEPEWLLESLRQEFWDPAELDRGLAHTDPIAGEQQWWSILGVLESLGPPAYAAMFASACQYHAGAQVRWSLLAMLRDAVKHEQVCHIAQRRLSPQRPAEEIACDADAQLRQVQRQVERKAGRCWREWQRALHHGGVGVLSGAMLLRSLTLGGLYDQWSYTCAVPALALTLRNLARDHRRHQCALRAVTDQSCRTMSGAQRAIAALQVEGTARLLSLALLDPQVAAPIGGDTPAGHMREQGLGMPTAEQRLEVVRTALLEVRDLHARHGIGFHAMPELAIPAASQGTITRGTGA